MNEGKFYEKRKKKKENPPKKTERGGGKKRKQNFSLCWCFFAALKKQTKTNEEETKKKAKASSQKEKRTRKQKNHIMSADALKQKGNEAFKRNEFKLACEIFTEAIELDATNHVLYSNRSAARVILIIMCIFCAYSCVHFRSVFRSSSSV